MYFSVYVHVYVVYDLLFLTLIIHIGKLMGMAVRTNNVLTLKLAPALWKLIVEEEVAPHDLLHINSGLRAAFESLTNPSTVLQSAWTEGAELDSEVDPREEIDPVFFTADSSLLTQYKSTPPELHPGGRFETVTPQLLPQYLRELEAFVLRDLTDLSPMVAAVRKGVCEIIPALALRLLTGA